MRTRRERNIDAGRAAVVEKKIPNIYPPSIFDPLLQGRVPAMPRGPDPEGVARDAYLAQLAAEVAAGEADSPEPEDDPGTAATEPRVGKPQGSGS